MAVPGSKREKPNREAGGAGR